VQLPGLARRQAGLVERVHDLVGEIPLLGRKWRWIAPRQTVPNVRVDSRPGRRSELIRELVQLTHLLEKRLETLAIDSHGPHHLLRGGYPAQPAPTRVQAFAAGGPLFFLSLARAYVRAR
jgi:hypothetical protein